MTEYDRLSRLILDEMIKGVMGAAENELKAVKNVINLCQNYINKEKNNV